MRERAPPKAALWWGIAASLLAWASILLPRGMDLIALGALLIACWITDRVLYPRFGLQGWLTLRAQLTTGASLSCFLAGTRFWIA